MKMEHQHPFKCVLHISHINSILQGYWQESVTKHNQNLDDSKLICQNQYRSINCTLTLLPPEMGTEFFNYNDNFK